MGKALKRAYLSARWARRDELNAYALELASVGVEVTSRWLTYSTPSDFTEDVWRELAEVDREDIARADCLVLFSEGGEVGGGGRHVEFGIALGMGKPAVVVGGAENLFHRLPDVQLVNDWSSALELLAAR